MSIIRSLCLVCCLPRGIITLRFDDSLRPRWGTSRTLIVRIVVVFWVSAPFSG